MAQLNVHNRTDGLQELVPLSGQLDSWIQTSIVYAVEGAVIAAVSLPYVIVVALCSTLREQKEYVIFAALSFAYSLFGIGYMIAGIVRSIVLFNGNALILTSRWSCYLRPWNIIYVYAGPLANTMELVISIDRLIAVFAPMRYFSLTSRYAFRLVVCVYLYQTLPVIAGGIISYVNFQVKEKAAYCLLSMATSTGFFNFYSYHRIVTCVISILLYIPIAIQIKRMILRAHGLNNEAKFRRMKSVTITVGITAMISFISVIPDITSMIGVAPTSNYFYYVLPQVSGMVNSIIYTLRYKDLRAATVDLFTCRFQMAPQQKRTTVQAVSFNKAPSGSGLKS